MTELTLTTASVSHIGYRARNEDSCAWVPGCWTVADGLGGHGGGEVAARLAVDTVLTAIRDQPPKPAALQRAILRADQAIIDQQSQQRRLSQMRTTLVLLVSDGCHALWAHVGDSRLYHLRDGQVQERTRDHSVPQALADAGLIHPEDIRHHPDRNRLLRCLGSGTDPGITVGDPITLTPGDTFLLCTDGFWESVTDQDLTSTRAQAPDPDTWLNTLAERIQTRADPAQDNYTALSVWVSD